MKKYKSLILSIILAVVIIVGLYQITSVERYYVTYNTYVRNDRGELVEQDENKHLTLGAKSLDDAKDKLFEIENQLYEDVTVDSISITNHVIVKEY